MARIVLLQFAAAFIVALAVFLLSNFSAGLSALLGGLSCALPNAFFAFRLYASTKKPGGANPMSFFIGEFIKIGMTLSLMGIVVFYYQDLNWLAFLAAFILVMKSYLILLFRY